MAYINSFVEQLRCLHSDFICDGFYNLHELACNCALAADVIEKLNKELEDLKSKELATRSKNQKLTEELEFTRDFIVKNDMQYALISEWSKKHDGE